MAFGSNTFTDIGGGVSDIFGGYAKASGLRLKAQGDLVEAGNYDLASTLAKQNEQFTEQSTGVKQMMADRQIQQGIGTETADIASDILVCRRCGYAMELNQDLIASEPSAAALSHIVSRLRQLERGIGYCR